MQHADLRSVLSAKVIWPAAVLCLLTAGLYVFIELAEEIMEGESLHFDEYLLLALRNPLDPNDPLGPPWMEEAALELTTLGGYPFIVILTVIVAGYLGIVAKIGAAFYVMGSVVGGSILSAVLKEFFERPRPDLVDAMDMVHTASFPSGHATVGTVVYLTLGALMVRYARSHAERIYVIFIVCLISVLVGFTRVYLGVHWPSDVLAGWALGLSWAAFVWCFVAVIEYRHPIRDAGIRASGFLRRIRRSRS